MLAGLLRNPMIIMIALMFVFKKMIPKERLRESAEMMRNIKVPQYDKSH